MNGNNQELYIKLSALDRLYRKKEIDKETYVKAVMQLIGVNPK